MAAAQMTETVIVTGGAGFVGRHVCERLLEEGWTVLCIDNLGSGQIANVKSLCDHDRFQFIVDDITKSINVAGSIDAIYHLASRASPTDFQDYAIEIALSNSRGTHNVLELAKNHDASVVLASTSEVYGDPDVHPQPEDYWGHVNPNGPRSCYDESKRFAEALAMAYHRDHGVDVRIARFFNTYGPHMRTDDGRAIPTFINQALLGSPLTIHGEGTQTRSFCYIDDLVRGILTLATTPEATGEVINLGNPAEITINEVAEIITDVAESDSTLKYVDRPEDDPDRRRPDITKAREMLGWEPRIDLQDGLERTVDWFQSSNPSESENPMESETR